MGFYHFQNEYYFNKKCIVDTVIVNDVTHMRQSIIKLVAILFFL